MQRTGWGSFQNPLLQIVLTMTQVLAAMQPREQQDFPITLKW